MSNFKTVIAFLLGATSLAQAEPVPLAVGEQFIKARAKLYAAGWRADSQAHAASGEYIGLDRQLVQSGFSEVDYCSVGESSCVLQYKRGDTCLRLHTQGEQTRSLRVTRWSNECRERTPSEDGNILPADVRYLLQWRNECESFGQCEGISNFQRMLRRKYAHDSAVMKVLR